LENRGDWI